MAVLILERLRKTVFAQSLKLHVSIIPKWKWKSGEFPRSPWLSLHRKAQEAGF